MQQSVCSFRNSAGDNCRIVHKYGNASPSWNREAIRCGEWLHKWFLVDQHCQWNCGCNSPAECIPELVIFCEYYRGRFTKYVPLFNLQKFHIRSCTLLIQFELEVSEWVSVSPGCFYNGSVKWTLTVCSIFWTVFNYERGAHTVYIVKTLDEYTSCSIGNALQVTDGNPTTVSFFYLHHRHWRIWKIEWLCVECYQPYT